MKNLLFFIAISLIGFPLTAQQLPLQSQFNDLQGIINPAAMNTNYLYSNYTFNIGVNHRSQWTGIPNAPKTNILYVDYVYENDPFSLISGGHIIQDQVSRIKTTGFYGKIGGLFSSDPKEHGLSLGLSGGVIQYAINTQNAQLIDEDDVLALTKTNKLYPDIGFGVAFYKRLHKNDDLVFGGLSVPQILGLNLAFRNDENNFDLKRTQHYYAQIGYLRNLYRETSFLELTSWIKYVKGAPVNIDVNLKYQITDLLYIGSGLNSAGMYNGNLGLELNNRIGDNIIRLNYGFGLPFFSTSPQFGSSHEIGLFIGIN